MMLAAVTLHGLSSRLVLSALLASVPCLPNRVAVPFAAPGLAAPEVGDGRALVRLLPLLEPVVFVARAHSGLVSIGSSQICMVGYRCQEVD